MKKIRFIANCAVAAALAVCAGCASGKSGKPEIPEEDTFTPIRAKYRSLTPSDLTAAPEVLRIAVVDVAFQDGKAAFGFLPGEYRPQTGFCHLLAEKVPAAGIHELVEAIDPYVDRMPFGILFTYGGRPTSAPDVAESLPPDYAAFFQEFRAAMEKEDIDFVCLLPAKVTFLK